MNRALRFSGLVALNIVVAVFGTAFVDGALRWAIPPHSVTAVVLRGCITSILGAASLGFSVWRIRPHSAAKWTWVVPTAWFVFGVVVLAGGSDVFGNSPAWGLDTPVQRKGGAFFCSRFRFFALFGIQWAHTFHRCSALRPLDPLPSGL